MSVVIYRETVEIDGRIYTISESDYSAAVEQWEVDGMITDNQSIVDMINDDIAQGNT